MFNFNPSALNLAHYRRHRSHRNRSLVATVKAGFKSDNKVSVAAVGGSAIATSFLLGAFQQMRGNSMPEAGLPLDAWIGIITGGAALFAPGKLGRTKNVVTGVAIGSLCHYAGFGGGWVAKKVTTGGGVLSGFTRMITPQVAPRQFAPAAPRASVGAIRHFDAFARYR